MDNWKLVEERRARSHRWAERHLELDCLKTELVAQSRDALRRSRQRLDDTNKIVEQPPSRIPPTHQAQKKSVRKAPAKLTSDEAVALRRIALGSGDRLRRECIRRLQALHLIEADKASWRLTPLGQQQLTSLPAVAWRGARESDEIERILAKFAKQGRKGRG